MTSLSATVGQPPRLEATGPSRLGFFIAGPTKSGPSRYVDAILQAIDPREFAVTIFGHPAGPYADRRELRFVPIQPDPGVVPHPEALPETIGARVDQSRRPGRFMPGFLQLGMGSARESWRLARILRQHPVDLLHAQETGCEEAPIAARLARTPQVLGTFHVDSTYDLDGQRSGPAHRLIEHLSNWSLHRAIAVSAATKADWVRRTRLPASRIVTIHNGIAAEEVAAPLDRSQARRDLGLPSDRVLIGGVGRLDRAKGFAHLIEALAILGEHYPSLDLVLAGQGPLRGELEARAEAAGIGDRVHFLGYRSDVRRVYQAIDLFCFPSECETLGYALLEAMAAGLAAVGAAVGGIPEVIEHATTGFLVPARDPAALARALRLLLDDDLLRSRMGAAARRRVAEQFDERVTVERTLNVYREMLAVTKALKPASKGP